MSNRHFFNVIFAIALSSSITTTATPDTPVTILNKSADTSVYVDPGEISLPPQGNFIFRGLAYDGEEMLDPLPEFTWQTDGGAVNSNGTYWAPKSPGKYKVTAAAVGKTGSATVTVDESITPAYKILTPNNGETFKIGDKVRITWESDENQVKDAVLSITLDGGFSLLKLDPNSITPTHDSWEKFDWVIPEKVGTFSLAGKELHIHIGEKQGEAFDLTDIPLKIVNTDALIKPLYREGKNVVYFTAQNMITVNSSSSYLISISNLSGRVLHQYRGSGNYILPLLQTGLAEGMYILRFEIGDIAFLRPLLLFP